MTQLNIMALRCSAFYSALLPTIADGFLREEGLTTDYVLATPEKAVPDSIAKGD